MLPPLVFPEQANVKSDSCVNEPLDYDKNHAKLVGFKDEKINLYILKPANLSRFWHSLNTAFKSVAEKNFKDVINYVP